MRAQRVCSRAENSAIEKRLTTITTKAIQGLQDHISYDSDEDNTIWTNRDNLIYTWTVTKGFDYSVAPSTNIDSMHSSQIMHAFDAD